MPRPFPIEFRARAVALVRAAKPVTTAAVALGTSAGALHTWVRQDQIDRGERDWMKSPESAELPQAEKRIRQLEAEVEVLRQASPTRRRRAPGQDLLAPAGRQQPRLLP